MRLLAGPFVVDALLTISNAPPLAAMPRSSPPAALVRHASDVASGKYNDLDNLWTRFQEANASLGNTLAQLQQLGVLTATFVRRSSRFT